MTFFVMDERLGIPLPHLELEWEAYSPTEQAEIVYRWEQIRGRIPDRIVQLEGTINVKQAALRDELNFKRSCELNSEIAELASIINDLQIWYRINAGVSEGRAHL